MAHTFYHSSRKQAARTAAMKRRQPKTIKRYGNRKLYDTEQSSYVVLQDIEKMIRNSENIQVIDNETKKDITAPTLAQIILGAERKSKAAVPLPVLKSIIMDGGFSSFLAKNGAVHDGAAGGKRPSRPSKKGKAAAGSEYKLTGSAKKLMRQRGKKSFSEEFIPKLPGSRFDG